MGRYYRGSTERKRFRRRQRAGICQRCPKRIGKSGSRWLCRVCLLRNRLHMRKMRGLKRWKPGGPGRKPLTREASK
jgi:hypothetical protein